ncbi:MAG: FHA domain-containing protein [Myxococcota bacterium]
MSLSVVSMLAGVVALLFLAGLVIYVLGKSNEDKSEWEKGASKPASAASASTSPSSARKYNWLVGKSGDVEGKSFHVGKRTATIGRGVGNFIQIGDENSSRVNSQFEGVAAGLRIKDMDSSNGTRVNGEQLAPEEFRRLEDGDEVQIGDTVLIYRREGNYRDAALTDTKDVKASQQKQTQALGSVGGAGDLTAQVKEAVERAGGDYEKAAREVGLDPELVERIVEKGG